MITKIFSGGRRKLLVLCFVILAISCSKSTKSEVVVYNNDFESGNLKDITNGRIEDYSGGHVLGRYNASGFGLTVNNLPKHDLVIISFDLYINGSWDGNKPGAGGVDGPDIWQMLVNGTEYINTTFSNQPCAPRDLCPPQSYPSNYPNYYHNPRDGAAAVDLPAVCNSPYGSTLYKIQKTINHTSATLLFQCIDQLIQSNVDPQNRICDESWSIDNIQIKTVTL